jgi:YidC/Oxa1 family membrane protein insertase
MDRKSLLVLVVSFAILLVWFPLMNHIYAPKPGALGTNSIELATRQSTTNAGIITNVTTVSSSAPVALRPANPPLPALTHPAAEEQILTVENAQSRYLFTSFGGGLKSIELKAYPESVQSGRKANGRSNEVATLNTEAPVPALTLLGPESVQGNGQYQLARTATGVRAEQRLTNGLTIVKEFNISTNYLLNVSVRFTNASGQPLTIPACDWVIGSATPLGPKDDGQMLGIQWYNGVKTESIAEAWFANRSFGCVPGQPRTQYLAGDGQTNVVWVAVANQFFTLAVMPQQGAPRIVGYRVDLAPPTEAERVANPRAIPHPFGLQAALVYPGFVLTNHQTVEKQFTVYAGPKEYKTLAQLSNQLNNNVDLIMGFGGFWGFFAKGLLLSMNFLHQVFHLSYGLSIIAITVILKILFWPLTNASTRSMKRMSALQPQMKALQEKYKDDPKRMNAKLMEFMKENKVSPVGGCLPTLLQIPVLFGFYTMLRSAIELRGARFLWAADLSNPDTVWIIPGLHFPLNPLPLMMGVTMLWQSHMTPPSPGMDPMQQKMMKYMPLIFIPILYNFSAGLSLYWTVQNLLTIAQMKLIKPENVTVGAAPRGPAPAPGRFDRLKKK